MKSYTIHLIRHGITEGNLLGQYIGRTDSPLAAEGIRALQDLKEKYKYPEAQAYYCSPMSRCIAVSYTHLDVYKRQPSPLPSDRNGQVGHENNVLRPKAKDVRRLYRKCG